MRAQTESPQADLSEGAGLWSRAREVFERALAVPRAERPRAVSILCGNDPALVKAVHSLLAWDVATSCPNPPLAARDQEPDLTGTSCAGYRLVRSLGRGGAGVVYLAERTGIDPPQRVAIKLLSRTFAGEAHLCLIEESRILARLDHPGIARLIHEGLSEQGQSFLAMEWIDGDPLTVSCDARRLTLASRLGLFRAVCRAVEHAHRRLVIHLDLKPPNILVDRAGRPCLLDFGIAKRLDAEATPANGDTRRAIWLSPGYASPEQVLGGPVSPASDIYSLGIVLYEMLTGLRPQPDDPAGLLAFFATGAPRPSEAVLGAEPGFSEAAAAARRLGSAEALGAQLAGHLDTIVGRCLELRPERRYRSAGQLVRELAPFRDSED